MAEKQDVSRRTVLKASAWAAPVIAVAAATPLAAASSEAGTFTINNTGWLYAAGQPSNSYIRLIVQNAGTTAPTSGFVQIDTPTSSGPYYLTTALPETGQSWDLRFALTQSPASDITTTLSGSVTLDGLGSVPVPQIYSDI